MSEIKNMQEKVLSFVRAREWDKKYSAKNMAMDIAIESTELMEIFQWLSDEESNIAILDDKSRAKIEEELADVLWTTLVFADLVKMDLPTILDKKIELTDKRYPVDKSKGNRLKHTEL